MLINISNLRKFERQGGEFLMECPNRYRQEAIYHSVRSWDGVQEQVHPKVEYYHVHRTLVRVEEEYFSDIFYPPARPANSQWLLVSGTKKPQEGSHSRHMNPWTWTWKKYYKFERLFPSNCAPAEMHSWEFCHVLLCFHFDLAKQLPQIFSTCL